MRFNRKNLYDGKRIWGYNSDTLHKKNKILKKYKNIISFTIDLVEGGW